MLFGATWEFLPLLQGYEQILLGFTGRAALPLTWLPPPGQREREAPRQVREIVEAFLVPVCGACLLPVGHPTDRKSVV